MARWGRLWVHAHRVALGKAASLTTFPVDGGHLPVSLGSGVKVGRQTVLDLANGLYSLSRFFNVGRAD